MASGFHASIDRGQVPVLVWVGDIAQGFRPCASLIRLEVLHGVDVALMESRQTRLRTRLKSSLWLFRINVDVFDQKLGFLPFEPGVLPREFIDEIVESSPKIVNNLSDDNGSVRRDIREPLTSAALRELLAGRNSEQPVYRLVVGDDFLLLRFSVSLNEQFQFVNMSISPVDPGEGSS